MSTSSRRLKALLFDVDGTLTDTDPLHRAVYKEMLTPFGYTVDHTFFTANIQGRANVHIAAALLPQLNPQETADFFVKKEAAFNALATTSMAPLPGLLSVMSWARANDIKIAAVTNAPYLTVIHMFNVLGLATGDDVVVTGAGGCRGPNGSFDVVVVGGAGECTEAKPHPQPYQLAMKYLNVTPDESIVFEDSLSGVRAGINAGCMTIGVMTGRSLDDLMTLGCTDCIHDYTEINTDKLLEMKDFVQRNKS